MTGILQFETAREAVEFAEGIIGAGLPPSALGGSGFRGLVICPAGVRMLWQRQLRKYSVLPRVSTYPITKSSDGASPYAQWTITSYDLARTSSIGGALMACQFDALILDAIYYLKTADTQRTCAVFGNLRGDMEGLMGRARAVIGLPGVPRPRRGANPRLCA